MGMVVLVLQSGSRAMMMVVVNKERFLMALDIPLELKDQISREEANRLMLATTSIYTLLFHSIRCTGLISRDGEITRCILRRAESVG
jgi:hypothetical protein